MGGQLLHLIPVAEGEGEVKKKRAPRKKKVASVDEKREASLRRDGLRSARKAKEEEEKRDGDGEGEDGSPGRSHK